MKKYRVQVAMTDKSATVLVSVDGLMQAGLPAKKRQSEWFASHKNFANDFPDGYEVIAGSAFGAICEVKVMTGHELNLLP